VSSQIVYLLLGDYEWRWWAVWDAVLLISAWKIAKCLDSELLEHANLGYKDMMYFSTG
jgi:hypothetical protein